jgi:hypothetical protein
MGRATGAATGFLAVMTKINQLDDRALKRGRLLAARTRTIGSVTRYGILTGQWDGGDYVRRFMRDDNSTESATKETYDE